MGIKYILTLSIVSTVSNAVLAFVARRPLALKTSIGKHIASQYISSPLYSSASSSIDTDALDTNNAQTVLVFGGSGYVGRRVCEKLVSAGCNVISLSRSGKPPPYYCDGSWCDAVSWMVHDLDTSMNVSSAETFTSLQPKKSNRYNNSYSGDSDSEGTTITATTSPPDLPTIDAAISCVGDIQPDEEWSSFFGLAFDDDRLYRSNGLLNKHAIRIAKDAGAQRFAFISVSYEVAKFLEGPIEGYIDGKRLAESTACELFGTENTIVVGASFIYGGKRFPMFGKVYRAFVESFIAKAYVGGNDALRGLSQAPLEDWVEKSLFSSPVEVEKVAGVLSAAALGLVTREMVGDRKQGFFDLQGQPIDYDNVLCVDGTQEIERVDKEAVIPKIGGNISSKTNKGNQGMPVAEGALVGKGPFLYPIPVVAFFLTIVYCLATNQFVTPVNAI